MFASSDGAAWAKITGSAAWGARLFHTSVVYDDKIYLMGGWNGASNFNDVWSSSDGATWNLVTSNAAWSARRYLRGVVYDNKIFVMGGKDDTSEFNDVWNVIYIADSASERKLSDNFKASITTAWYGGNIAFLGFVAVRLFHN